MVVHKQKEKMHINVKINVTKLSRSIEIKGFAHEKKRPHQCLYCDKEFEKHSYKYTNILGS